MMSGGKMTAKKDRREKIIQAAEEIIFSVGLEPATMDDIADQADVSKGTLYYYFKNKADLYYAISGRGLEYLNQRFAAVLTEDKSGIEMVRRLGEEFVEFIRNRPEYFDAMMYCENYANSHETAETLVKKTCIENERQSFAYILRTLQIGLQDGTINQTFDPQRLAIQLTALIRGLTQMHQLYKNGHYTYLFNGDGINVEQLFEESLQLMITGMESKQNRNS